MVGIVYCNIRRDFVVKKRGLELEIWSFLLMGNICKYGVG